MDADAASTGDIEPGRDAAADGTAGVDLTGFWRQLSACSGDVPRLLDVVARQVAEVVGEGSVLSVLADDGETLQPAASHHPDPEVLDQMRATFAGSAYRVGEGVAGSVVADRRPVVLSDLDPETLTPVLWDPSRGFHDRYPIRSLMIVPLVAFGEVLGTLGVMRSRSAARYSDADRLVLEGLAERAALAIADARGGPPTLGLAEHQAIFRHSLDGVLFSVPDGRILAANPAACAILQRSEAEIRRLGRAGLVVGDDPRTREAVTRRAVSGSVRAEVPMIRGDGTVFTADLSSTTFTNEDGDLRACVIFHDVSEQVEQREQLVRQSRELERLVDEDPLSGVLNRRGFMREAERALEFADREHVPVQLLFCDLDNLKLLNDRYGHQTGDALLARLGSVMAGAVRAVDVAARLSGDEFVVLLYGADADAARDVLDRMTVAFETPAQAGPEGSFSVGIAERAGGSSMSLADLLHAADQAMQTNKTLRRIARGRRH